jgi:hypothetical protein
VRLRYRIDQARMRWRVSFGGNPPGLLAAPRQRRRERREIRRDITGTIGLVLAVGGFFLLIAAVCAAVFLLNS